MLTRPARSRPALLVAAVVLAVLATGCDLPSSDGGEVVQTTDDRIEEVRAAREVLAEPVPDLLGEAGRLVVALEQVWTEEAPSGERAALAASLQLGPFEDAIDAVATIDLEGDGQDVTDASALLDELVREARDLQMTAEEELASIAAMPAYDQQLEDLLTRWDARGSYTQQLQAFEELAADATALAAVADERDATPACVELWPRRSEAATVVAERTRELHALIRDRRGQEFDELRDSYRQDPYDTGDLLGVLDAAAAADCWAHASAAPAALLSLEERVTALGAALDPADLRG